MEEQNQGVACNERHEGCLGQLFIHSTELSSRLPCYSEDGNQIRSPRFCVSGFLRRFSQNCLKLRHISFSVRLSAWNSSSPTGRIFIKFSI